MEPVFTSGACPPRGHYHQAVRHNGLVYVSGILGITPQGDPVTESVNAEFAQLLTNLKEILAVAGSGADRLLKVTLYVADLRDFSVINAMYADFLGEYKCARSLVPICPLPLGLRVELDAVAAYDIGDCL